MLRYIESRSMGLRRALRWPPHRSLAGCDVKQELLAPQNPGIIDPSAVNSAPAARGAARRRARPAEEPHRRRRKRLAVRRTARRRMEVERHVLAAQRDRPALDPDEQRQHQTAYNSLQQARGYIKTAIDKSIQYTPDANGDIAEMYFALGFMEMELAENFCNGIPLTLHGRTAFRQLRRAAHQRLDLSRSRRCTSTARSTLAGTATDAKSVLVQARRRRSPRRGRC